MAEYITELANDIAKSCPDLVENGCGNDNCVACLAFKLMGLGYKKQTPTADVVPKSEVERLNAELVRVQARHPFAMTLFELEACEKHAAIEAVKEVWRELRSKCDDPHWCVWLSEIDDYFEKKTGVKTEDIDELKYTEDNNDG